MSDTSNTAPVGSGQEPPATGTPGQEPTATPPATPAGTPAPTGQAPAGTPPEGQEPQATEDPRVKAANAEAARYRREAREAQARAEAAEAANLSDAERVQKERDDLAKQNATLAETNKSLKVNAALTAAAQAAGLRITDTVEILGPKIQLDADGNPTGVTEAVTALLTERPYLAVTGTPGQAGPGAAPGASGQPARYKRSQLADPSFYEEHRADIMKALQEGRIDEG